MKFTLLKSMGFESVMKSCIQAASGLGAVEQMTTIVPPEASVLASPSDDVPLMSASRIAMSKDRDITRIAAALKEAAMLTCAPFASIAAAIAQATRAKLSTTSTWGGMRATVGNDLFFH